MAAAIPWTELCRRAGPRLRVLDPMAGSGTTAVVARALGHRAIGFDTDPLAVLLAQAWCADVDPDRLVAHAERVLKRAKAAASIMRDGVAYPEGADSDTKAFIRYWFDKTNRRQLAALAKSIQAVRDADLRTLLWCAFSRLIIVKQAGASLALDLAHSRPHRALGKQTVRPFEAFLDSVGRLIGAAPFRTGTRPAPPAPRLSLGDARRLPLTTSSVDVIISSPPYVNGIDYQRTTKFSLVWMGHSISSLRTLRSNNVGTEAAGMGSELEPTLDEAFRSMGAVRKLPAREQAILKRYLRDMNSVVAEMQRVLVPGGRALLVIGDSSIRGVYVRNSAALAVLAETNGLRVATTRRRRLPPNRRYLPPPSASGSGAELRNRMRTEVLLGLTKSE